MAHQHRWQPLAGSQSSKENWHARPWQASALTPNASRPTPSMTGSHCLAADLLSTGTQSYGTPAPLAATGWQPVLIRKLARQAWQASAPHTKCKSSDPQHDWQPLPGSRPVKYRHAKLWHTSTAGSHWLAASPHKKTGTPGLASQRPSHQMQDPENNSNTRPWHANTTDTHCMAASPNKELARHGHDMLAPLAATAMAACFPTVSPTFFSTLASSEGAIPFLVATDL